MTSVVVSIATMKALPAISNRYRMILATPDNIYHINNDGQLTSVYLEQASKT